MRIAPALLAALVALAPTQGIAAGPAARSKTAAVASTTPPTAFNGHPNLVILLVLDQFRADYLERYRADFKPRGFRLFLDHGASFPDCYYDYANTETAPGHSTIGTGAYTNGHGIGGNDWWDITRSKDHRVTSVEDERYRLVGVPQGTAATPGASPRNLLASTVGDELRLDTRGVSKLYGVSLKDRAAILPAGATANGAFWIDKDSGRFITSSYYMPQLPDWANAFNESGRIAQAAQEAGTPGTQHFYNDVGRSPAAVSYEIEFAQSLIENEQLGSHDVPDMLTLSLSSTDILGHRVGPDADEQRAMVDAIDADLDSFFMWLDRHVPGGLGNVWIALTADHGIAPLPETAAALGLNAARWDMGKLSGDLNYALNQKFSPGEKIAYLMPDQQLPYLALNQPSFERAGINEQEAEQAVLQLLPAAVVGLSNPPELKEPAEARLPPRPMLFRSYSRQQIAAGELPHTEFGELVAHSYTPNGGWYVMLIPDAFQLAGTAGTSHFSAWSYDRHVPMEFYGAPFAPGIYHGRTGPVDIAATFASLLGVNQPSASAGHILTEALKPVGAVSYPRPRPANKPASTSKPDAQTGRKNTGQARKMQKPN